MPLPGSKLKNRLSQLLSHHDHLPFCFTSIASSKLCRLEFPNCKILQAVVWFGNDHRPMCRPVYVGLYGAWVCACVSDVFNKMMMFDLISCKPKCGCPIGLSQLLLHLVAFLLRLIDREHL